MKRDFVKLKISHSIRIFLFSGDYTFTLMDMKIIQTASTDQQIILIR